MCERDTTNRKGADIFVCGPRAYMPMHFFLMSLFPGQEIEPPAGAASLLLGGGVTRTRSGALIATVAGPLRVLDAGATKRIWVAENRRRYIPAADDVVVGVVVEQMGEAYAVDINAMRLASLDILAFDGASRRNCPDLQPGALVFARVTRAMADVEPQLSCTASHGVAKKDWTSGESAFGELRGGMLFDVPRATCRTLAMRGAPVLEALGRAFPFEAAVGLNGRVWVSADHDARCVVVAGQAMRACAGTDCDVEQAEEVVKRLMRAHGLKAMRKKKRRDDEAGGDEGGGGAAGAADEEILL